MAITIVNNTTKRSKMSKMIAAHKITLVFLLCFALGLSGCDNQKGSGSAKDPVVTKQIAASPNKLTPAGKPLPKKQKDPAAVADSQADTVPAPVSARLPYNAVGKVDPFAPLYKEEKEKKAVSVVKPKGPERPRTPLEKLDLGQLKLTAIVTTQGFKRALVEEASGKGYVVMVGTKIGLERGSVVKIEEDRLVIEHQGEDSFGKIASEKRELKLQKPPGD